MDTEPSKSTTSVKEFAKIDGNATSCSMNGINANERIRVQQDADLVLENLKLKRFGQRYDEVLVTTDKLYKHYKTNDDRKILTSISLFRKYYGETGSVKHYQNFITKQLVDELHRSLHGEFGKHPGNTETIIAYRQKCYHPKRAQLFRQWVISCEQCNRESRID